MVKRKSIILAIFVIFLFSLSAVSAGENATDDAVAENVQEDVELNVTQTPGTFQELYNQIYKTPVNGTLELDRDYENVEASYIPINKNLEIDGQGHTLDSKSSSRIFGIAYAQVILKNITFINGKSDFYGGAIYLDSYSILVIQDCNFINCSAESGGAIYCDENSELDVYNSSFINCSAQFGGAIYYGPYTFSWIYDSNFTNNVAEVIGGSLYSAGGYIKGYIKIERSNFKKSIARYESGGAFTFINTYFDGSYLTVSDCGSEFGGAVTLLNSRSNITRSVFKRNSAIYSGGAIYAAYGQLYLEDNEFSDNSANRGGAAFISLIETEISDNLFKNNTAAAGNAVYALTAYDFANMSSDNYGTAPSDFIITVNNNLTITGGDYYQFSYKPVNITVLPEYYSMVDENLLTPVKDQGTEGNCWAFAAMAALESCILKASDLTLDLSEANLKNLMALYSSYGYVVPVNDGGHDDMVFGYLASWLGPIFEIDDNYYINDYLSPLLKSILHIQNIAVFKRADFTDNDAIKNAIIQYGAVATGMYYDDDYMINEISYYYGGNEKSNHAVCIVGWDDSYSRYNFNDTPQGDGAWIVRNSWGPSWGDGGYFYVSYYDTVFAQVNKSASYTFILNDTVRFDRVYQYEIQKTSIFELILDWARYKNVFIAKGGEYLAAVSTVFVEECDYTLEILVNGTSKATKTGKAKEGYYTINLDDLIYLNRNDRVDVIFDCSNFTGGHGILPVSDVSRCTNLYIQNGTSLWWNNVEWEDLSPRGAVLCIKMFTKFTNDHKISPYIDLSLDIDTADGGYILEVIHSQDVLGNVSITYDQNEYVINLTNENSIKLFNLQDGDIISARYWGDEIYSEKTVSLIVDTNISPVGTFDDLTDKIRRIKDGEVLNLTKDFAGELAGEEIVIRKAITIDGQGHSINANHLSRIFSIQSDNVVLKNIKFIAGYHNQTGSALLILGENCSVVNCTFTDCLCEWGAAVYCFANNTSIINSTFTGNSGYQAAAIDFEYCKATVENCKFKDNQAYIGAAITSFNSSLKITDSTFENNTAYWSGGAIYLCECECEISRCSFTENYAPDGGAVLSAMSKTELVNCSFTDNHASERGGAVFCYNATDIFSNCSFVHNYAYYGGAVYSLKSNDSFVDCNFTRGYASQNGASLCLYSENCIIDTCLFENNYANSEGALYWNCGGGTVVNSVFKSNIATGLGGAVVWYTNGSISNCHFEDNFALYGGAVCWYGHNGILMDSTFVDNSAAILWVGDDGILMNSNFTNNINSTQIIWDNDHSGTITGCRFINSTRNNVENDGADFIRRNADPHGDDASFTFNDPQAISFVMNGVSYDLPITSDYIFNFTKAGESKSYRVNSTSIYDELYDLSAGVWAVNVIFEGDDNYDAFDCQFTLTVNPAVSYVKINDTSAFKGHETEISAAVLDAGGHAIDEGTVSFYDGNALIKSADVIAGVAKITYVPQTGGKHTIKAVYESGNYVKSNETAILTVDEVTLVISLENGKVGFKSTFRANVTGLYSTVNEGKVKFYIGDECIGEVSVSQGFASVDYVPLKAGNHTVRAVYSRDSNFEDAEDSATYHVEKADSALVMDDVRGTFGGDLTLTAHVTSSNGLKISEGKVTFMSAGVIIGVADVRNGEASVTYTPAKAGSYQIAASFEATNYLSSGNSSKATVDKADAQIAFGNIESVYYKSPTGFEITLKSNNKEVNEGSVGFYVNGQRIHYSAVVNGKVTFDYTFANAGTYQIIAAFGEAENYNPSNETASFTVMKLPTSIVSSDITTVYNQAGELTVTLKDKNNAPLANVEVSINSIAYKTDSNGQVRVSTNGWNPNVYVLPIAFAGSANYDKSTSTVKVTVLKATPKLTASKKTFKRKVKTKKYTVTLKTNINTPLAKATVSIKVNGKTFKATTAASGKATFKIKKLTKKGTYKSTVTFAGNGQYNKVTKTVKITVK